MPGYRVRSATWRCRVTHAHRSTTLTRYSQLAGSACDPSHGRFTYTVAGTRVVDPSGVHVIKPAPGKRLVTLTTCNPKYSAATHLIVRAKQTAATR